MKKASVFVWLPLAFIVGGLVGAYGPTEEFRTREERADAEKAKAKARQKATGAFGSFAQIVNIPDEAKRPHRPRRQPVGNAATNAEESAAVATDSGAGRVPSVRANCTAASKTEVCSTARASTRPWS